MTRSALALSIAAALGGSSFAMDAAAQQAQGVIPTSPVTFSASPAVAIPDNLPGAPTCSTIGTAGIPAGASIDNVEAVVGIDHTWVGDLIITLESPAATTITLLDRPNVPLGTFGCSNNDVNVRFADGEADPENVCSGAPPQGDSAEPWPVTDASPVPGDAMADFNGQDPTGNWTLCVSDNAGGDTGTFQTWGVTIAFTAPEPAVSLSIPSQNFGNQDVGAPTAPVTVTIENTGDGNLDLGTLTLAGANPGDFGISADGCSGASVAPAATCSFDVTATPTADGVRNASVSIPSNAPSSPDSLPLEVTGNPVIPALPVPVNSAWATIILAGMLGLFGWLGLRRTARPAARRKM